MIINPYAFVSSAPSLNYILSWTQGQTTDTTFTTTTVSRNYVGLQFFPSLDVSNIARVELRLLRVGNPTGSMRVSIWQGSGATPSAQLGDWSDYIDVSTVGVTEQLVAFDINTNRPSILSSVANYYVILDLSTATRSGGNYIGVRYSASVGSEDLENSTDAVSWTTADGSQTSAIQLYVLG